MPNVRQAMARSAVTIIARRIDEGDSCSIDGALRRWRRFWPAGLLSKAHGGSQDAVFEIVDSHVDVELVAFDGHTHHGEEVRRMYVFPAEFLTQICEELFDVDVLNFRRYFYFPDKTDFDHQFGDVCRGEDLVDFLSVEIIVGKARLVTQNLASLSRRFPQQGNRQGKEILHIVGVEIRQVVFEKRLGIDAMTKLVADDFATEISVPEDAERMQIIFVNAVIDGNRDGKRMDELGG